MLICCVSVSPSTTLQLPQPIYELSNIDINFLFKKNRERKGNGRKKKYKADFLKIHVY